MDPFSIVLGVTSLLGLAGHVLNRTRKYIHGVKNAIDTAAEFAAELEILQSHLKRLVTFLHSQHDKGIVFSDTCVLQSSVNACQVKLTLLDQKLSKTYGKDSLRRRLRWPLEEKEHRESISELRAFGQWIQMGLTVDGCMLLSKTSQDVLRILGQQLHHFQMLQDLNACQETLQRTINDTAQTVQANREAEVRNKILDWISSDNPNPKHDAIRSPRVEGTGAWLLRTDRYQAWREALDSTNFLWCHGMPGAGKSVLSSLVIDDLRYGVSDEQHALAFVYFDYREQPLQSPEAVFASILRQFLLSTTSVPKPLRDMYDNPKSAVAKLTLKELEDAIRDFCSNLEAAYIVLDALDEIDASVHRMRLLDILGRLRDKPRVRVFITSRPVGHDIQIALKSASQILVKANELDLHMFLTSRIETARTADIMDAAFKHEVVETILRGAQGMFLLPELQIRAITEQPDIGHMKLTLRTMPADLSSALTKAIDRIRAQPEYFRRLGMDTLLWVSHAKAPLTVRELRDALAIPSSDKDLNTDFRPLLKYIVESCYGLVTVDEERSVVRLSHYSIQEHLRRHGEELFPNGESFITQQCLKYLSFDVFHSGPLLGGEELRERMARYGLLYYAASQWGCHAQSVRDVETITRILAFLHDKEVAASAHQILRFGSGYRASYYSPNECYSCNPLHIACHFGNMVVANILLDSRGFEIDAESHIGSTALIRAAARDQGEVVKLLLTHGADPNKSNWYGNSLHCAAEAGCRRTIEVLVKSQKVDIDCRTSEGRTPLHCCVDNDHAAAAGDLLKLGADMYAVDDKGCTALHLACLFDAGSVVRLLCESGMDLEQRSNEGHTPLHMATRGITGYSQIIAILLDHGANIEARDNLGQTPLPLRLTTVVPSG